ncbi:hypothetical protein M404DRAFT_997433, partial [Pisolithus tinctorius Marx 270]
MELSHARTVYLVSAGMWICSDRQAQVTVTCTHSTPFLYPAGAETWPEHGTLGISASGVQPSPGLLSLYSHIGIQDRFFPRQRDNL